MKYFPKYLLTLVITITCLPSFSYANWQVITEENNKSSFVTINKNEPVKITTQKIEVESLTTNKDNYNSNEQVALTYRFNNQTNSEHVSFTLSLPETNQFISEDTFLIPDSDFSQLEVSAQRILWQGLLAKPQLSFTDFDNEFFGYLALEESFGVTEISCSSTCENDIWAWDFPFQFQGETVDQFYITKSGKVLFDNPNINTDQPLSYKASLANIAPMFSGDFSQTELRVAEIVNSEFDGVFLVIEWTNILDDKIAQRYQIIIEKNTSNIWFNYLDILSINENTQAGAQNNSGLVSFNILNNNEYSLITEESSKINNTFKLINKPGGQISLNSTVKLNEVILKLLNDQYQTQEDSTLELIFINNVLIGNTAILHTNSNFSNDETLQKVLTVNFGSQPKVEIIKSTDNGKLSINAAIQHNDNLYLGINLNSHFINYERSTYLFEENSNLGSLVNEVGFENNLSTIGNGFSFQLGGIAKLSDALRVGLSYDSPTWYTIQEETTQYLETVRDDNGFILQTLDPQIINVFPEYKLQTPSKLTGSLALILDKKGLISFDYSRKDYGSTKFTPESDSYNSAQNTSISNNLKIANTYRIGGEIRHENFSFRGGYKLEESPYNDTSFYGDLTGYSFGIGYNFGNSKLDLAYENSKRTIKHQLYNVGLTSTTSIDAEKSNVTLTLSMNL